MNCGTKSYIVFNLANSQAEITGEDINMEFRLDSDVPTHGFTDNERVEQVSFAMFIAFLLLEVHVGLLFFLFFTIDHCFAVNVSLSIAFLSVLTSISTICTFANQFALHTVLQLKQNK